MLRIHLTGKNRLSYLRNLFRQPLTTPTRRLSSSTPPPPPPPLNPGSSDLIGRILRRTPKFLHSTLSALHNAPFTHISAFLILHEITAFVPLLGLAGAFHYFQWLPPYFAEGKWVVNGVEKFGKYFRRKGWIDDGSKREASRLAQEGRAETVEKKRGLISKWWGRGEMGTRLVVEFATAYAMVKLLLPLRVLVSVWGAPWFAKWTVVPFNNMVKASFRKSWRPQPGVPKSTGPTNSSQGINGSKNVQPKLQEHEK